MATIPTSAKPKKRRNVPAAVTGANTFKFGKQLRNMTIGAKIVMTIRLLSNKFPSAVSSSLNIVGDMLGEDDDEYEDEDDKANATAERLSPMKEKKTVQMASCCAHKLAMTKTRKFNP